MKNKMKKSLSNNVIIGLIVLFFLIILSTVIITVFGSEETKQTAKKPNPTIAIDPVVSNDQNTYANAVFLNADPKAKKVLVQDVDTGEVFNFDYSGKTTITDKYDQLITASQISKGQIVRIVYNEKLKSLIELKITNDTWENIGITELLINTEAQVITYLGKNFSYGKGIVVLSQGNVISVEDILPMDYVTIRGYEENIYSIVVTRGHGYLELTEDEQFIGGTIYVGTLLMEQITEHMLLTVSEGNYELTVENKSAHGTKAITVQRDKTTQCSLKEFEIEEAKVSQVTFNIFPELSKLYVDGVDTNYVLPVELTYGEHEIEVSMGGYFTYQGNILVSEPMQIVAVTLEEKEGLDESSDNPSSEDNTSDNDTSDNDTSDNNSHGNNSSQTNDSNFGKETITIEWTTGADVYFDGSFIGTIKKGILVTDKKIGTFDIDFVIDGEDTVSYRVTVEDDGEDVVFSFPTN